MAWDLSDDEVNGVSISVNTILRRAWNVADGEDWSYVSDEWWNRKRLHPADGMLRSPFEMIAVTPGWVVEEALKELSS